MFRNVTLKCLTEIAAVSVPHYDEAFVEMFRSTMQQLEAMLPIGKIFFLQFCTFNIVEISSFFYHSDFA